jgi:curli biogenesis system outer membrane secretion channel CsgG
MRKVCLLVCLAAVLGATAAAQQPKRRVAVMNFDYATVRSSVSAMFGTEQDVGKGIADLIINKLVGSGTYSVIERSALDKIMAEQNFSNSDRADANTAAKIGRVLGVDAIIVGSITQFGRDDKSTGVGGGAVSRVTGRFGVGGVKRSESKAVVGVTARIVDTSTAEILGTATGSGESTRSGTSLLGAGGGSIAGGGAVDMASKNFANTIIGEAVTQAVLQLSSGLDANVSRVPLKIIPIDGLVADASGNSLVLNVGSRAGVRVGDRLQVRRKTRDIKDPATGKVLRSIESQLGEVVITEVDERSAVGDFTGATPARVGDVVKR